jgi:hypothetical protein
MTAIRNRIVGHLTVRAGDLLPHPNNWRRHPDAQRQALAASLHEVGFARSLLGYRRPDGRIQLIDGHLRAEHDPDLLITVELVDVTPEEAQHLLLTLDPLAALAEVDAAAARELARLTQTDSKALQALWDTLAQHDAPPPVSDDSPPELKEQYLVLIECQDEAQQRQLLERFQQEGLPCKALIS